MTSAAVASVANQYQKEAVDLMNDGNGGYFAGVP